MTVTRPCCSSTTNDTHDDTCPRGRRIRLSALDAQIRTYARAVVAEHAQSWSSVPDPDYNAYDINEPMEQLTNALKEYDRWFNQPTIQKPI